MTLIKKKMSIEDFAVAIAKELEKNGIEVILVGGAVVSIYSKNKYQSKDVDFLSVSDHQKITGVMRLLGFKNQGKDFFHPQSQFSVEFPGRTLVIGDVPQKPEGKIKSGAFILKLLSPTQCVMDRLAAFYHWKDRQSLDQAVLVSKNHSINLEKIKKWSTEEGMIDKFKIFSEQLRTSKKVKLLTSPNSKLVMQRSEKPSSVHPWRACPYGEHSVVTHELHVPPSKAHPNGIVVPRHFHCAKNPSHKDQLYPNEIHDIADRHFKDLKNKPCSLPLEYRSAGSKYDDFIAGWTQYWNEVLNPTELLDPNLVKALVATESRFIPNKMADSENPNSARGLTQITNETRKTLDNVKGEIKDHYVTATRDELNDPNVNICAGVRWLFHKQILASNRLKRNATWPEAIYEYKGLSSKKVKKADRDRVKNIFNNSYETYQKCGKK